MIQAASQIASGNRGSGDGLARLAEQPELLERGLKVLDVGLRLTPDLTLDLLMQDAVSRPVVVLWEGDDGVLALLGRAMCVLAEMRRSRGLLERLFRAAAVSFAQDPRMVLCARRFPDAMIAADGWFQSLGLELAESQLLPIEGAVRLAVVRAGGGPRSAPPATDLSRVAAKPVAPVATVAPVAAPVAPQVPPPAAAVPAIAPPIAPMLPVTAPAAAPVAAAVPPPLPPKPVVVAPAAAAPAYVSAFVDEAKQKILRIGDEIEEEVDGELIRFRLRDAVLAIVEAGPEVAIWLGDAPELRRRIRDRNELELAVDDVVRRYFTLIRQVRPRVLNGDGSHA